MDNDTVTAKKKKLFIAMITIMALCSLCIILYGVWDVYNKENARLAPIMAQQKAEIATNSDVFNKAIEQITADMKNGIITPKEANDRMLKIYKKSLDENQATLEKTINGIIAEEQ